MCRCCWDEEGDDDVIEKGHAEGEDGGRGKLYPLTGQPPSHTNGDEVSRINRYDVRPTNRSLPCHVDRVEQ